MFQENELRRMYVGSKIPIVKAKKRMNIQPV